MPLAAQAFAKGLALRLLLRDSLRLLLRVLLHRGLYVGACCWSGWSVACGGVRPVRRRTCPKPEGAANQSQQEAISD